MTAYFESAPAFLEPFMFAEHFGTRTQRRVLVEALREEVL